MAKEKIEFISNVTKSLTKKGKLKDKKLKKSCCHMVYSKKGKLKSKISVENGKCTCMLCGATFEGKLYTKDEVKQIVAPTVELLQGAKYTSAAAGVNNEGMKYLVGTLTAVKKFPKYYGKVSKVVAKQERKKKGNSGSDKALDSSSFGSWSER